MMTNLFSIFDPSTSINYSLNSMGILFLLLFIPKMYWLIPSKYMTIWNMISNFIYKEISITLNKNINFYNLIIFKTLFIFIMLGNFISLFPYIFNTTSHMLVSLSMSMIVWMSFMLFGWLLNSSYMFTHLTPQSTPYLLMPFMVIIESISNLIRPLTLAIRLSANIIAGHLLMTLISKFMINLGSMLTISMILIQSLLVILEIAVSFIQAYVFMILGSLYSAETN